MKKNIGFVYGDCISFFPVCIITLLLTMPAYALDMAQVEAGATSYREGELLVKFKAGTPEEIKNKIHEMIGSEVIKEFRSIQVQHVSLKKGLSVDEALRLYRADPNIEYAEPDYNVKIQK
ncbi:MAG: hypothetical protein HZB62_07895 [Nitrospirae bacterium]|nr:hypothetical protein [Nitrospirota bacterium]